jgi:phosphocarrier protein FPr/phosphocarrier protein
MSVVAELSLVSPLTGPVLPLERVPDPVFAGRLAGDGVAIEPLSAELLAPCDGVVTHLHRSGHAITVTAANGAQILIHIGVDTVRLGGRGFVARVVQGARVRAGDVMIVFDADRVGREAVSLHTMVVVANEGFGISWRASADEMLRAGSSPLMTVHAQTESAASAAAVADREWSAVAVVGHEGGIHARPAALVNAAARAFSAEVIVELDGRRANAKSIVSLMALGASHEARIRVHARGADGEAALAKVVAEIQKVSKTDPVPEVDPPVLAPGDGSATLRGVCAAPGIAIGRVVRLDSVTPEPPPGSGDPRVEHETLAAALARVHGEIDAAARDAQARGFPQRGSILVAHLALLHDPEILGAAERAVAAGASAGMAYRAAVGAQCSALSALGNPLLAERAADLRELERRVLLAMVGGGAALPDLFEASIVVADDIGISELSRLPAERVAGLSTVRGGETSHLAIVARALGIPALVAVGPALLAVAHGQEVLLDANAGCLVPDPDAARAAAAREAMWRRASQTTRALARTHSPAVTRDGRTVEVAANVATPADVREAVRHGADGVGLMRTELLFLGRTDEPSEAEQARTYQAVIDALDGRRAIIRTLDAGGDKPLRFLPLPAEENPALGLRGVRSALFRPQVLDRQLRALLAVEPLSSCRILLPMVTDAAEVAALCTRIDELCAERGASQRPEIGVMVEVPSAAVLADQLAAEVDFLSLGTNDLTQYALAMDRGNAELAPRLDGLHPAVLRLIAQTVEGAARHGKWVGVCGALASDLEAVPVLVGLGVSELSVDPPIVPEVKARVRGLDQAACAREARDLLGLTSAAAVRARARALWPEGT